MSERERLASKVARLAERPGVYLFKDGRGRVLYVGKSVNLRSRVRSYFQPGAALTPHKQRMVSLVRDLDFLVAASETEALIVEYQLINAHDPPFNIIFRDDKAYPMLKLTREEWPRLLMVRRRDADGARYFGPYPDAGAVRLVLQAIRSLVPLRTCKTPSARIGRERGCLNHDMGLCRGPCTGAVSHEEYAEVVERVTRLLRGDRNELRDMLRAEMERASGKLEFERAAVLRDRLQALERIRARQRVVGDPRRNEDVVAVARRDDRFCVQVISVRGGRLEGQRRHFVQDPDATSAEVLGEFLATTYLDAAAVPEALLVSEEPAEREVLAAGLRERCSIDLRMPEAGKGHRLVEMALENASLHLAAAVEDDAVLAAQKRFGLAAPPSRIECFDVSLSGGRDAVASLVVFVDGRAAPALYRRFRIKTVEGTDDFAMLAEAVGRRYRRLVAEGGPLPDLVMVDGGLGQVSSARAALDQAGVPQVPVYGLAKREERIHGPGLGPGLVLSPGDPVRRLFERIRDEAHRRAVGHHRLLRGRRSLASALDRVPGVGPKLRKALLERFGDVDAIRAASPAELLAVPGVGPTLAARLVADLAARPAGAAPRRGHAR